MTDHRDPRRDLHVIGPTTADHTPPGPTADTPESEAATFTQEASAWIRARAREATDTTDPAWPPEWLTVAGTVLGAAIAFFGILLPLTTALADLTTAAITWAAAASLPHLITDPVRAYLTAHTAALPLSADQLMTAWAATGLGLFVLAWTGSIGGRIAWTLIGAASTAMVYAATPTPSQALAAGITALTWGVASIAALRRITHERETVIYREPHRPTDD